MNSETKVFLAILATSIGLVGFISTERYRTRRRELAAELKKLELEATYPDSYWKTKEAEAKANADIKKAKIESDERIRREKIEKEKLENERRMEFEKSAPDSYWKAKEAEARANADIKIQQERSKANIEMMKHENDLINEYGKRTEKLIKNSIVDPYDFLYR